MPASRGLCSPSCWAPVGTESNLLVSFLGQWSCLYVSWLHSSPCLKACMGGILDADKVCIANFDSLGD